MADPILVHRSPRIQPELPVDTIKIPAPPQKDASRMARLLQLGLPFVTILGYVVATTLTGAGRSQIMLVPMALAVVAATAVSIYSFVLETRQHAADEQAYAERLMEMHKDMRQAHEAQRRFYCHNYPDTAAVLRFPEDACAVAAHAPDAPASAPRLWERCPADVDFGVVRLGQGVLPSTVVYELDEAAAAADDRVWAALKLQAESRTVSDIPIVISLRRPPSEHQAAPQLPEATARGLEELAKRTPVTPSLGVTGDKAAVYEFARAVLSHYVAFHAPTDAHLYVLAASSNPWKWTRHVSHCRGDQRQEHTLFLDTLDEEPDAEFVGEDDEGAYERYLERLRKVLSQRKLRLEASERNAGGVDYTLPFCLLVVDLLDMTDESASPLGAIETAPALSLLLENGAELGAAVIFLASDSTRVPGACQSIIHVEKTAMMGEPADAARLHFRYAERGLNTFRYMGVADTVASLRKMATFSQALGQLDLLQGVRADLSPSVPFMEFMGYGGDHPLQALEAQAWANWQASIQPEHADWLRAKLGMMAGNKPRILTFSAKRDGVHGMVAGSTGSGKSELLISLICALAVTYDPRALNFVLVDFKGGGAFKGFEELPHCVDVITNLRGDGVTRMFSAITAELNRRQELNTRTGTKNIVEYRQRGLHETCQPYPFLFIIIDEFAEMIAERPEYRAKLDSITRLGRALGVSLLLAAQRPTGVTDQMRANIKFRVCLRVETTAESREMLRRDEAAYLPGTLPGRGYLQVGSDELELIQAAFTGDAYVEPAQASRLLVTWPDRPSRDDTSAAQDHPPLYKVIVSVLARLAKQRGIEPQQAPWPSFLPTTLALSSVLLAPGPDSGALTAQRYLAPDDLDLLWLGVERESRQCLNPFLDKWLAGSGGWVEALDWERYALRPVVGLIDNPARTLQMPLAVDLRRGHVAVFGGSGWGKTTFVRSLVVSLAASHSPDALHVYVLDLGGQSLHALASLPHVGAVISADEDAYEERVEQLVRELQALLERRKQVLGATGQPDVLKYNAAHLLDPLPAVVVVIDNFAAFKEGFGGESDTIESVLAQFEKLAREAKTHGIHFVITAQQPNVLSGRLYSLFTERFALRLADLPDYRDIVGSVQDMPGVPGRGYVTVERMPLSFQVATPFGAVRVGQQEPLTETQWLERLGAQMQGYIQAAGGEYRRPVPIGALPKAVLLKELLAQAHAIPLDDTFLERLQERVQETWQRNARAEAADWLKVTVGLLPGSRPRTLYLEANHDGVHALIAGATGSGKSELLTTLVVGLALNYPPDILNFVLVDYKGGGAFKPFATLPHCVDLVTNLNTAAVQRMFTAISAELDRRQRLNAEAGVSHIVEYRRLGLHKTREPYPHLVVIIDEYAEMIDANPEYRTELERIARLGRSLGVNLILASQQPKGVTDQMRANIKLRMCLRVQEPETSHEVLRRPDAAALPNRMPGRGYLQAGADALELIQVAYVGEAQPDTRAPSVVWPDRGVALDDPRQEPPKFFDWAVGLTAELADGRTPRRPWPPFLPAHLTLQSEVTDPVTERPQVLNVAVTDWLNDDTDNLWRGVEWWREALRPVVGLLDDPAAARQYPLHLSLDTERLLVLGDSGGGKTTFLRSLLVSLAATHSPDELHVYVVDLGGRNFRSLETLPHVGAMLYADEEAFGERLERLLDWLDCETDARLRRLSEAGCDDLFAFNSRYRQDAMPAILVVIDNAAALAGHPLVTDVLTPLLRRSLAAGITFTVTANNLGNMAGAFINQFGERITFKQNDAGQYRDIVGSGAMEIDSLPGRGYIRVDRRPLMFQAALPTGVLTEQELAAGRTEADETDLIVSRMQAYVAATPRVRRRPPVPVRSLPLQVSLDDALEAAAGPSGGVQAVLGIGYNLQPAVVDLKRMMPHFIVAGSPFSGKTTTLYTWALSLAYRYPCDQVALVLIDFQQRFAEYGGRHRLDQLPHVIAAVDDMAGLEDVTRRLEAVGPTLQKSVPPREVFVLIDNFEDLDAPLNRHLDLAQRLETLARRYGRDGLHFVIACGLDGAASDFKRRIRAANFGIGLRTMQAAEAVNAVRLFPRLWAQELPGGRGYLARSGRGTLLQIATPWPEMAGNDSASIEDRQKAMAECLDGWVERIQAQHAARPELWVAQACDSGSTPSLAEASGEQRRTQAVLREAMRHELERLQRYPGQRPWLTEALAELDLASWGEETMALAHLKAAWERQQIADGSDASDVAADAAAMTDLDCLLRMIFGGTHEYEAASS